MCSVITGDQLPHQCGCAWIRRFPETTMPAKVVYRLIKDARELDATPRWAEMCQKASNVITLSGVALLNLCAARPMSLSIEHVL